MACNLNTSVLLIAWETVEPTEGTFDFSTVDGLLAGACDHPLHLVFLWFGAWKNTFSSYVPDRVKTDQDRFRACSPATAEAPNAYTLFSSNARDADVRAFAALMHHLKQVDTNHTIITLQVGNEVGLLPESRDHSPVPRSHSSAPFPLPSRAILQAHAIC